MVDIKAPISNIITSKLQLYTYMAIHNYYLLLGLLDILVNNCEEPPASRFAPPSRSSVRGCPQNKA